MEKTINNNSVLIDNSNINIQNIDESLPEEAKAEDVLSDLELDLLKVQKVFSDAVICNGKIISEKMELVFSDVFNYQILIVKPKKENMPSTVEVCPYVFVNTVPVYIPATYVIGEFNNNERSLYPAWKNVLRLLKVSSSVINYLEELVAYGHYKEKPGVLLVKRTVFIKNFETNMQLDLTS